MVNKTDKDYEIAVKKANETLNKTINFLLAYKSVWEKTRNLKVYEVSNYCGSEEMKKDFPLVYAEDEGDGVFNTFCEQEYESFLDYISENGYNDCRKYIGNTSSFYLTNIKDNTMIDILDNLSCELNCDYVGFEKSGNVYTVVPCFYDNTTGENRIEYAIESMNDFANEFYDKVISYMNDAITIAQYIDDFMKNQVDIFKEYLEQEEEDLEIEKENQEEIERKLLMSAKNLIKKYHIVDSDVPIFKKCVEYM